MSDLQKYTEKLEKLEKKQKYLDKCNKLTFGTYTKRLVALIIGFCLFNVELSYVLSIFGKDPLIDVTNQLITTILGTCIVYIIRAFFDTWSENKYSSNKEIIDQLNAKISEIEENTNNPEELCIDSSSDNEEEIDTSVEEESNNNEAISTNPDDLVSSDL